MLSWLFQIALLQPQPETHFSEIIQSISTQAELENFDLILQTAKNSEDELKNASPKFKKNDKRHYYAKFSR